MSFQREVGKGLLGLIVALGLVSLLLMMLAVAMRQLSVQTSQLRGKVQVLESLNEVEVFLRREFRSLQFVPYCAAILPAYKVMAVGDGVSDDYRGYLQNPIRILAPREGAKSQQLDMRALRGFGTASYTPPARKNLTGVVLGSDVLEVSALLPTGLYLQDLHLMGNLTADLIGVRYLTFYITDCRESIVLSARRSDEGFILSTKDQQLLIRNFELSKLQIYVVKEYLFYTRIEQGIPHFVIDFFDGQAFLRVPDIVDLRFKLLADFRLSVALLAAKASYHRKNSQLFEVQHYKREIQNVNAISYRELFIALE